MNNYTFDEIQVGTTESFDVIITKEMMEMFLSITGDSNPLHCDEQYALNKGYNRGCVVYGMLTSSFYSTLVGVHLPGERCLLLSVDTKMHNPVFIGDTLTVLGTVDAKHEAFHTLTIKAVIKNQDGKKVSKAVMTVAVRKD